MKILKRILLLLVLIYLGLCFLLYTQQKRLLFPAYLAKPVAENWQPHAGDYQRQAMIDGHCGKLHVVLWNIHHAKGTLMMFHGNGESVASVDDYAYAFHQLGYNLMTWDYPGYGRSTDCWFSQDDLLADAENAYQWLAHQEKSERIFLFGYSLGTALALNVASRHPQNPVYLVAAYDSLKHVAQDKFSMLGLLPLDDIMRTPMDTTNWLSNVKQPIYLIHGTQDALIKPQRAAALVHSTLALSNPAKIEWVQGAGHTDDALFLYRNEWLKRLLP